MSTTQENMSHDCVYMKFEMKRTELRAVSDSRKEDRAAQVLGIFHLSEFWLHSQIQLVKLH